MAVDEGSFEKMKENEKNQALWDPWETKKVKRDSKAMKTREGKLGGFKNELSLADLEYVNEVLRQSLSLKLPYRP